MAQDPRSIVRWSSMLFGDQVGIIDAMDSAGPGSMGFERLIEKRRPVIYPFNRNGPPGFIAPINPYA